MHVAARIGAVVGAAALSVTTLTSSALAEGNGQVTTSYHQLRVEALDGATNEPSACSWARWRDVGDNGDDSPIDTNDRAFVVNVCDGDYADAYTNASLNIDRPAADVKNLSFDLDGAARFHLGAGSPRISVVFTNGDVAYLSAYYCNHPIGVSSHWLRADFTGFKTNCGFYVTGMETGGFYEADGTRSAWQVYVDAHPDQVVSYSFLVMDEPGNYRLDRIALGTNRLYNYSNGRAIGCQFTESRC